MAKGVNVKTPVVPLFMAAIDREDYKFHNYGSGFSVPADSELVTAIDAFVDDNFTKGELKHPKFKRGYTPDAKVEGNVTMFAKSKHAQIVVDAKGRAIAPPAVGTGTQAVLKLSITKSQNPDQPGVMLRYYGCQIIKLVEREGAFGDMSGQVEGGYEGDEEQLAHGKEMELQRRVYAQARKDQGDASTGSEGEEGKAVAGTKANTDF